MSNRDAQKSQTASDAEVEPENSLTDGKGNPGEQSQSEIAELNRQVDEQMRYFEAILSSISDFAYTFDREGRFVFVNQALLNLWGLKLEEAVGKNFFDLAYPDDLAARLQTQIQQVFDTKQRVTDETLYTSPTGVNGYYEYIFSPFFGAEGEVELVVGTTRDITKRKQTEVEISQLSRQNREILESITDAFFAIDEEWRFRYVNKQAERILDREPGDLIGRIIWEVYPGLIGSEFEKAYRRAATGRVSSNVTAFYPDHDRWYEVNVYPATNGITIYFKNATERVRTEKALRESEERFRRMADHAPVMIWVTEADGKCTYLSQSWYEFTGQTPETGLGFGWINATHPDDQKYTHDSFVSANNEHAAFRIEYRLRRKDGEYRWAIDSAQPRFNDHGEFLGYIGSVIDITERKKAEEDLKTLQAETERQRRLYDTILSNTPDLVYVFNLEHRFIYANDVLLKMWGKTWDEAIGKNCLELGYEPWHAEMHDREIEQVIATKKPIRGEVPFSGTFGRRIYDYIFVPIIGEDGEVEAIAGTTRDITERQQMEEVLRHSEEQYRTLFNSIDEGFCTIEILFDEAGKPRDYRFLEYNPAFEELTGLQNAAGKTALELVPDLEKKWFEIYGSVALTGEPVRFEENSEPMNRWFDVYASRIGNADSRKVALVFTNITERKKMEEALIDADRRKDEFLATLAHELRNPLAPIRSGLQVLRQVDGNKPKFDETLEIIERQTNQIVHLVDDLLDISRITQGKIKLRRQRIELKTAIEMALETSRDLIDASENELTISLPEKPIFINADLTRTTQIFLNILNNAAKYSDKGGTISLKAATENSNAVISIKDTGLGIEPEMLGKIFEMFGQIETPYEQARGGLGIGLSVVEKLVEMHGGSIEAFSEGIGKGSEFIVRLPLAAEQSADISAFRHSEDDILQKAQMKMPDNGNQEKTSSHPKMRRVLVVDDNRDAVEMMETLLSLEGYATRTAFDGETAVEIAREFQPEICLCDIGLPEMNGYELAGHLRKLLPEALLVSVSGWGQEEDRQRSIKSGFNYHLVKPVQFEDLLNLIKRQPSEESES